MIRVLHVLGGLAFGGAETMIMNIYRNIDKSVVQFDFIIHTTKHQDYYDEVLSLGGKVFSFPKFNGRNYFRIKKIWKKFFIDHPEYKILHSHIRSYSSVFIPIAKKNGLKTIIHSHSTSNGSGFSSFIKRILQFSLRWKADYFMACSKESGEWLFGKKVVNGSRFLLLKNAIDLNRFTFSLEARNRFRNSLSLQSKTVFIHVGRLHESKNHEFLLRVFSSIRANNQDAVLLLVGDGPLKNRVKQLINNFDLGDSVFMLGSRDDIPYLLSAADCFLFPSIWEGVPVSVVEAQASGLHCLLSDTITRDVGVSDLVKYLPIDKGIGVWIHAIEEMSFERKDVTSDISNAGFDIFQTVIFLTNKYGEMIND